jgi:drug/metabolite transporter (DMT)-like permease
MPLGRTTAATGALIGATVIWGSTFVVTKRSLAEMTPEVFLAWRFGLAAVVLLALRPRRVRLLSGRDRWRSGVLGLLLAGGFMLQTFGLERTSAGLSGFLTGTAVILTPVAAAVVFGERVGAAGWGAVVLAAVGVVLLAGGGDLKITPGALLTLGGAVCFAGHISGLSQWATRENAYAITAWSVAVAAAVSWLAAVVAGTPALPPTTSAWAWVSLLYLALGATCLGFVVQAWSQSALTAAAAAVVMTMEPVFAALLGLLAGEHLPPAAWLGGLVIVTSMFVAEFGPRRCCDVRSPRVECC